MPSTVGTCEGVFIGSAFALQEATIALAMLVNRFRFQLEPGAHIWPSLRVMLRPQSGVSMRIEPKTDRHFLH
jgi:cytochrome P450